MSFSVFGISLTVTCPVRFYFENSGCGVREGIGADAPMSIYGECVQADLKIPFKSKRLRLPRLTIKPLSRKTQKRAHLPQGPFFSFFQLAIAMVDGISPAQPNFINPFNNDFIRFSLSNVFR